MTTTQEAQTTTEPMMPVSVHNQFKQDVVRVARVYAQRNNWCDEVNRALEEMGLINQFKPVKVTAPHLGLENQVVWVPEDHWPSRSAERQAEYIQRYLQAVPRGDGSVTVNTVDYNRIRFRKTTGMTGFNRIVVQSTIPVAIQVAGVSEEEIATMEAEQRAARNATTGEWVWRKDASNYRTEVKHLVRADRLEATDRGNNLMSLCDRATTYRWWGPREFGNAAFDRLRPCANCTERAHARGIVPTN